MIRYLGEVDTENHYLLFFFQPQLKEKYENEWERYHNLESVLVPWSIFSPGTQLRMPSFLRSFDLDIFHSLNYMYPFLIKGPRILVTIHDLIPLKFPHFTPRAKKTRFNFLFRWVLRRSVQKADLVIAVSRQTRDDLIKFLGLEAEKIRVIYNGVGRRYRPLEPEKVRFRLKEEFGLTAPFALFVGRFDPYKNIVGLLKAFKQFIDSTPDHIKLVIAGPSDPRYPEAFETVKSLRLGSKVIFLDKVDEEELIFLYNGALTLVLPSFYEGFGLPPLEAMACGTPVICSEKGALLEVVGDAALLINPEEEGEMARALEKVCSDEKLRSDMRDRGLKRARLFSWQKTAEETLAVYQGLIPL